MITFLKFSMSLGMAPFHTDLTIVSWDPETQAPWPPEPGSQGASQAAPTKTGAPKAGKAPCWEAQGLWPQPPKSLERRPVSLSPCLIRSLPQAQL